MKCYIRRCKYNKEGEREWLDTYLKPYFDERKQEFTYITHWVCDKREATIFKTMKEATWFIKTYDVKNCDVYKI